MRCTSILGFILALFTASVAFAATPQPLLTGWAPAADNALTPDTFIVYRQVGSNPAWDEVCRATLASPTCIDRDVPTGVLVCWRMQAMAGERLAEGDSPAKCATMAVFRGTMTVTIPVPIIPEVHIPPLTPDAIGLGVK